VRFFRPHWARSDNPPTKTTMSNACTRAANSVPETFLEMGELAERVTHEEVQPARSLRAGHLVMNRKGDAPLRVA
jgi:hypothetical protein